MIWSDLSGPMAFTKAFALIRAARMVEVAGQNFARFSLVQQMVKPQAERKQDKEPKDNCYFIQISGTFGSTMFYLL